MSKVHSRVREVWGGWSVPFNTLRREPCYQSVRAQKNMAAQIRELLLEAGERERDASRRDGLIPISVKVQLLSAWKL